MPKRQVFYSFHFDNDVMRVQQVRNMGVIEGNTPITPNNWEQIKRQGESSVKKWIDDNMKYKSCVVVLIGSDTSNRKWVKYEIEKAWQDRKGIVGIYIHNLRCPRTGISRQGANPFKSFNFGNTTFDNIVKCYNPNSYDTYNDIARNINSWIEEAIQIRNRY